MGHNQNLLKHFQNLNLKEKKLTKTYLNNFSNPSLDASQIPLSVIKLVTYFAGVVNLNIYEYFL